MVQSTQLEKENYEDMRSTVVDALRYELEGEALDKAAHEILARLREHGLDIPLNPAG